MPEADFSIAWLLDGVDQSAFFSEFWEKKVLHLQGRTETFYDRLFDVGQLNTVLWAGYGSWGRVQLANHAREADWRDYSGLEPNLVTLTQAFAQGDTIVINDLQDKVPALARLCRAIARDTHFRSNVNLYLTKSGRQGLSPHFDDQDVFVLQLSGTKRWSIYETVSPLPLDNPIRPEPRHHYGPPREEILMRPGDLLYVPRGVGHAAEADGSAPSLHLTIAVTVLRWVNLLSTWLQLAAEGDAEFRKSIPPGALLDVSGDRTAFFRERLHALLGSAQRMLDDADVDDCLEIFRSGFVRSLSPLNDRFLVEEDVAVGPDTVLRKRDGVILHCWASGEELHVFFPGGRFVAPLALRDALDHIRCAERFTPASLPIPGDAVARIDVASAFISQGILVKDT